MKRNTRFSANSFARFFALALLSTLLAPALLVAQATEQVGFHVFGTGGNGGPFGVVNLCPNQASPYTHWDLREFPSCGVPYEINGTIPGAGQPGVGATVGAVRLAAGTWSAASPAYINLFDNSSNTPGACPTFPTQDNRNCVAWDPAFPFGFNVLGVTYLWRNASTGIMLESDITMNPNRQWQGSPPVCNTGSPFGIETVMVHEFGHLLGLAHPNQFGCANDDPTAQTRMFSAIGNNCNTALHQADRDGINFLYTADLGDAADPRYPSLIHDPTTLNGRVLSGVRLLRPNDGAEHLFGIFKDPLINNSPRYQYEWLALCCGGIDDHPRECDARLVDRDQFDDGVAMFAECLDDGTLASPMRVVMGVLTANDVRGRTHDYATTPMFVNGWFDWNSDGDWDDAGEHAINGLRTTAQGVFTRQVTVPPGTRCDVQSRFRLDWGENVGRTAAAVEPTLNLVRYAAQYGEVEDYVGLKGFGPGTGDPPWHEYCHQIFGFVLGFPVSGAAVNFDEVCHPPEPDWGGAVPAPYFPVGGSECMSSTLTLTLDIDQDGQADELIGLTGPVCVTRSDPYFDPDTGLRVIDTVMDSLEMVGSSEFAGAISLHLAPGWQSKGQIRQSLEAAEAGVDLSPEMPADSYFDVYFQVESETLGASEVAGPAKVTAQIGTVPPGKVIDDGKPHEVPPHEVPDENPSEEFPSHAPDQP